MARVRVINVGDTPNGIALSPSGDRVYLANSCLGGSLLFPRVSHVSIVDPEAGREVDRIPVGRECSAVAAHPSDGQVYAANLRSGSVSIVDTAWAQETARVSAGRWPRALALSPSGDRLYVAGLGSRTVSVVDPAARAVTARVAAGRGPCAFASSPSGDRLYVANFRGGSVTVIDTERLTALMSVPVGSGPTSLALSPAGDRLYVANKWSHTISVVDTGAGETLGSIPVTTTSPRSSLSSTVAQLPPEPNGIAISRDGARLLVALWEAGTAVLIDTAQERVIDEYDLGGGRHGVGPIEIVADPGADRFYLACTGNALAIVTL
jgi:YVTN family beta-propeller protein